jgi:uncharacterized membrane-anchored protein YhcB (DUF1043 family)
MIVKKKEKKRINPLFAAITGAVIGAGVTVASVFTFKDKKNQQKMKKVLTNVKDQAEKYVGQIEKKVVVKKSPTKKR